MVVRSAQGRLGGQIDSRSAIAAACRRSLTAASSFAAMSMRSCCASERSCCVSARICWLSARLVTASSRRSIAATVLVRSASWPAMLAMSSSLVTRARVYAEHAAWASRIEVDDDLRESVALWCRALLQENRPQLLQSSGRIVKRPDDRLPFQDRQRENLGHAPVGGLEPGAEGADMRTRILNNGSGGLITMCPSCARNTANQISPSSKPLVMESLGAMSRNVRAESPAGVAVEANPCRDGLESSNAPRFFHADASVTMRLVSDRPDA